MRLLATLLLSLTLKSALAQLMISNGVGVVTRDTVRVLLVFAEVDFASGGCPSALTEDFKGQWPMDKKGRTQIPTFASDFFDLELKPGRPPQGFVTQYYHQASFGAYVMLGDYMPQVVTVPCSLLQIGSNGVDVVLRLLDSMTKGSTTAHGLPLSKFDMWSSERRGQPKVKLPDGRVDLLYVIWRNNRMITGPNTLSCAGYGVGGHRGIPFCGMEGIDNMASFNVADDANCAEFVTVAEHLHGIFGGNNWHSSGGRGTHTFLAVPSSYGLTGQFSATMRAPSGWDRWMMRWQNPSKKFVISATDALGREVNTELIEEANGPDGGTYLLRDFMATADAIRIKLPHIDWQKRGDVKNQYLWLENRRMKGGVDRYIQNECSNTNNGQFPNGTPGIYAYIQVGKDQIDGKEVYSSDPQSPNGLASPFWPINAEGNFDVVYRMDMIQEGDPMLSCNWNNRNVPSDPSNAKPNPFTGHNDLCGIVDVNDDGILYNDEKLGIGLSKVRNGVVVHDYHTNGDWLDAFSPATGKMELAMWTNPAPVPVYTFATDYENRKFLMRDTIVPPFENRVIHLSGLQITFREVRGQEMEVKIRWDGFELRNNVRWCGNILLHPNPFTPGAPSLVVGKGVKLLLDRGTAPQYPKVRSTDAKGNQLFTDPTQLVVDSGAVMVIRAGGTLELTNDSHLIVAKGGKLVLESGCAVNLGPKSALEIAEGGVLDQHQTVKINRKKK